MTADGKITIVPRIRGKVIQVGAQWTWEAWITIGNDDPENGVHLRSDDKFLNSTAAENDLKSHAPEIIKQVCAAIGGTIPTEFIDLNAGRVVDEAELKRPKTFGGGNDADQ